MQLAQPMIYALLATMPTLPSLQTSNHAINATSLTASAAPTITLADNAHLDFQSTTEVKEAAVIFAKSRIATPA